MFLNGQTAICSSELSGLRKTESFYEESCHVSHSTAQCAKEMTVRTEAVIDS